MKKFFRVLGYIVCALLIILCILLVITSALFGAKKTVEVFGKNIYVTDSDNFPGVPKDCAVLVEKTTAADLEQDKPVLYLKEDEDNNPTLGYVKEITQKDGVNYITVSYNDKTYEFPESKLVGRADYSSAFWGGVIRFIRTPLGVMVLAVLPCIALVLIDIIRAVIARRPEPEVIPKVKNADEETHTDVKLSVDTEGKAEYSKDRSLKPLSKDSGVLFNLTGKQTPPTVPKNERPIIPLVDRPKNANGVIPKTETAAPKADIQGKTGKVFDVTLPSENTATEKEEFHIDFKKPDISALKAEKTIADEPARNLTAPEKSDKPRVSEKTAEIPIITPKAETDAFFSQPSVGRQLAPQIGKKRKSKSDAQTEAEVEELLEEHSQKKAEKTAGKRSTQILASKSLDEIFADDDDIPSHGTVSDKTVDDILASLEQKK